MGKSSLNNERRKFLKLTISGVIVAVVAGVGTYLALQPQPSPSKPSPASTPAQTPTPAMIDLAKKEGSVTIYGSWASKPVMSTLMERFEAKYPGIKATYVEGYAPLVERLLTETRAGKHIMDVYFGSLGLALPLIEADALVKYTSKEDEAYPAQLRSPFWVTNHVVPIVIAYHRDMKKEDIPQSYDDLLKPKYKGKIGYFDPNQAPHVLVTMERKIISTDKWVNWVQAFKKQEARAVPGVGPVLTLIANREIDIGVWMYTSTIAAEVAKGAPIDYVTKPGTVNGLPVFISISKYAPNPNAARLMRDYAISEEGVKLVADLKVYLATRPGIPSGIPGLEAKDIILTPDHTLKDIEDSRTKWNKIMIG